MSDSAETTLLQSVPDGLFIGGEWRSARSGATLTVQDPATGQVVKTIADAGVEDGAAALDAAVTAAPDWARTPPRERSEILRRTFEAVQRRKDDLALLMTVEMGKPLAESAAEVTYGGEFLRWFAEEAVRITGRYGINPEATGRMIVSQHPVGPSLLITPWNFPLAMATRKVAPALAAGCTVVLKPAELTPLTTLLFTVLLAEAGLPPGVVNVITTSAAAEVTGPIIADPRLRKLSFTGSTEVGRTLLRQAADGVLRTSMELGGNAPFLVFDDADLDAAVEGAMLAKFRNVGQACTAANRFLVHQAVAAEFTARVTRKVKSLKVGRGTEQGVRIGPLINADAVDKADALVKDASSRGARVRTGGHKLDREGTFYAPTVVSGVRPRQRDPDAGDLRARAQHHELRRRGGRGAAGQRHRLRAGRVRVHPGPGPRPTAGRVAGDGDARAERGCGVERGRPVRWGQAVRHRSRRWLRGHRGVPLHQVHPDSRPLRRLTLAPFARVVSVGGRQSDHPR